MRDSSSVPVILSFRSQIRIANRSSSLRPESSGAWDSVCFGGAGFSLGSAASMECILTEAWLSGHWPGHGPLVEYWGDGILGLSGDERLNPVGFWILRYGATVPGRAAGLYLPARLRCCRNCNRGSTPFCDTLPAVHYSRPRARCRRDRRNRCSLPRRERLSGETSRRVLWTFDRLLATRQTCRLRMTHAPYRSARD